MVEFMPDETKKRPFNKALFGCLTAGLLLLTMMIVCFTVFFWMIGKLMPDFSSVVEPGDRIAQIDLEGMISTMSVSSLTGSSDSMVLRLTRALERAREDENVKAIVLRINSPGGEVTASDTLFHQVKLAAQEKPVVVYMDSMAASGGYYIACGATEIYANQTTLTGSIGVIVSTLNYEQLFDKIGLESPTFTSGDFKDTLGGSRQMREDEKEWIQNLVSQMYDRFIEVILEGRPNLDETELRALADGRVYLGSEAEANGLIDNLGYIEDAYARACELGKVPADTPVVSYNGESSLFGALGLLQSRAAAMPKPGQPIKVELQLPEGFAPQLKPGMAYLLPTFYAP
ncbi:MAG: protease-4 [Verrucomicrobiales bacterium]|jgi:protease-4